MRNAFTLVLIVFCSINITGQFNCLDGVVYTCNGFVDTYNIAGDLQFSSNSIPEYYCNGTNLNDLTSIGSGQLGDFGQDDIYIFNSIGAEGAFNSMTITLEMEPDDDLDIIAISSDCSYECYSDQSYVANGQGAAETITLEWEDIQTIILVVEAYSFSQSASYNLNFEYSDNSFDYCSYFPQSGENIQCGISNTYSSSLIEPQCLLTFPVICPPEMDYHNGEGPYFSYEHVYTFLPESTNGVITIDLDLDPGMKAFLYHSYIAGIDFTPTNLIASGSNYISVPYTLQGFDSFILIIDGPASGESYTFTIDYPGCELSDSCGDCFTYTNTGGNTCHIDDSNVPQCDWSNWQFKPFNGGSFQDFNLPSDGNIEFSSSGDYIVCYEYDCGFIGEANGAQRTPLNDKCCIVISVGQQCQDPPVAHYVVTNVQGTNNGHESFFDASSSFGADYYSWSFGNGMVENTQSPFASYDYPLEPYLVTNCLTTSNECGMSKYCMSYHTYGDGNFPFDCNLPFDVYSPPAIFPSVNGSTISFSGLSIFSGAEITFDPGDGSGEFGFGSSSSYTYSGNESNLCCLRINYPCFSICFCYTVVPHGYDCENDPYTLVCNTSGEEFIVDSNSPNSHNSNSKLTNIFNHHNGCVNTFDGCDDQNDYNTEVPFERHEVVYEIQNPVWNDFGNITIDLIPLEDNLDVDVFIYEACEGQGELVGCLVSSTEDNDPFGERDAILIDQVPAFNTYYVVVDGQSNVTNYNEGRFLISYTCGSICDKDHRAISCGETITGSTLDAQNNASYYCECADEDTGGPAGNFGPEDVYVLYLEQDANVDIQLDILSIGIDLELYLLNDCDEAISCLRHSRNSIGESEHIVQTLDSGTYYIVVEGFRGDRGEYELSISGCDIFPVPMVDCDLLSFENFSDYNDGDKLPEDDLSGNWIEGFEYGQDPMDNSLDGEIELRGSDEKLVFNSGNYNFQNAALKIGTATTGIRKVSWDMTLQYVDGDLYGGKIVFGELTQLPDISHHLEIVFGHDNNGNFAELVYRAFGFPTYNYTLKLADIDAIKSYNDNDPLPNFELSLVYDLDANKFTFYVDEDVIYTGNFEFATNLLEYRYLDFSSDNEQDYMEIDNIQTLVCEECEITYIDDCNFIYPVSFNGSTEGELVEVVLGQDEYPEESIVGYQVIDETTNTIINLSSLEYNECVPGRTYKFCVLYRDDSNCIFACCYRILIPAVCNYIIPFYSGDEEEIQYTYRSDLPSSQTLESWFVDGLSIGNTTEVITDYISPTTSYVCLLIYDSALEIYVLCCSRICVDYAIDCETIQINFDPITNVFDLNVNDAQEIMSWNIDNRPDLPNNGLIQNPSNFIPSDYGFNSGDEIWVSVRYVDDFGCTKVCCRRLCYYPIYGNECDIINSESLGNGMYVFSLATSSSPDFSEGLTYSIDGSNESTSNSSNTVLDLSDYYGNTVSVCCYFRDLSGCWRVCCREITVEPPQDAIIFKGGKSCGPVGSIVRIPVQVFNFEDITLFGFRIQVEDERVRPVGIADINSTLFNSVFNVIDNDIVVGWDHQQGDNIDLPDATKIFDIEIEILEEFDGVVQISAENIEVAGDTDLDGVWENGSVCVETDISISGQIRTEEDLGVIDTEVTLSGADNQVDYTGVSGTYAFESVSTGLYTLECYNNDNLSNGVTISDVSRIRRHYLEKSLLDSDYKMIAADINRNGSITISDVSLARRIYLQKITELSNNTSWRFVPADADISANPLASDLPEQIDVNANTSLNDLDFIGIKVGDVNNSAMLKKQHFSYSRSIPLNLTIDNITAQAGSIIELPIKMSDFMDINLLGFQMTWDSDFMNVIDIKDVSLPNFSSENFNILDSKVIFGWDDISGEGITVEDENLMTLVIQISDGAKGSSQFEFNTVECLDGDFNDVEVNIDNGQILIGTVSTVDQNIDGYDVYPNPFARDLTVSISEKYSSQEHIISIYNTTGEKIWRGVYNTIKEGKVLISQENFAVPGLYFVQIESAQGAFVTRVVRK